MNRPEDITRSALVERASSVADIVCEFERESDAMRALHPESVKALRDADLFKVIQPRRIGGFGMDLPTIHAITMALCRGCASTGWVYLVTGAHTWVLGMFPEAAQDEIKADDPDTFIPGTLASQGKAQLLDDGVRVSGRWQFASGCDHGRWGLFAARQSDSTREDPKHVHVLVPSTDYTIEDTWHSMGLRGTGSKDVIMDEVFVPRHRTMPTGDLFEGISDAARAHDSFVYRFPVLPSLTYLLTAPAPALEIARRIYSGYLDMTASRRDRYDGSSKAKKAPNQVRIAESWAEIQSAALMVEDITRIFDTALAQREPFDIDTRVEVKWRASYVIHLCRRAADRLFDAAGANSIYDRSALLPLVQSLHTASHHAAADFDNNATSFGSQTLGLGPGTWLV